MEAFSAMNFSLSTAFIVSHRFGYTVPSFSLNSKKSLISLFLPLPRGDSDEHCSLFMIALICGPYLETCSFLLHFPILWRIGFSSMT